MPTQSLARTIQQEAKEHCYKKPRSLAQLTEAYIHLNRGGVYFTLEPKWDLKFHERAAAIAEEQGWSIDR